MPTLQPLPALDTTYLIHPEQAEAYRRDGHIKIKGLCTKHEIEAHRESILDATQRLMRPDQKAKPGAGKRLFIQTFDLWRRDEQVARYTLARRFARVAAEIMGVERVRLLHDQTLLKEPHGGGTPWHQDQWYIPLDTPNILTMWMAMTDMSAEMGTMRFASGSHLECQLYDGPTSEESNAYFERLVRERSWSIVESGDLQAGDATFHTGWTIHAASDNVSERNREAMLVLYYEDGARITLEPRLKRARELHFGSTPGGALADRDCNPVVYP